MTFHFKKHQTFELNSLSAKQDITNKALLSSEQ